MSRNKILIENLYKKSYLKSAEQSIDEIYKTVENKILDASSSGMAEIYFDLPNNFTIGNLELKDAQLIIYSSLIEKLEENRLKVTIIPTKNGNRILHVKWPCVLDEFEKKRMLNYIKKHIESDNGNV